MKLQVVLEPSDEGGYTAIVPALPGCVSEGETREEALANIQEAVQLYLEPVEDDSLLSADAEVLEKDSFDRLLARYPAEEAEEALQELLAARS